MEYNVRYNPREKLSNLVLVRDPRRQEMYEINNTRNIIY